LDEVTKPAIPWVRQSFLRREERALIIEQWSLGVPGKAKAAVSTELADEPRLPPVTLDLGMLDAEVVGERQELRNVVHDCQPPHQATLRPGRKSNESKQFSALTETRNDARTDPLTPVRIKTSFG